MARVEKNEFEEILLGVLRDRLSERSGITVRKNLSISIKASSGKAELNLVYVKWAHGYYLVGFADHAELGKFITECVIPYKPRSLSNHQYCFSTLSEKGKVFANSSNGHFEIPSRNEWVGGACDEIANKIMENYLPRLESLLRLDLNIAELARSEPGDFSYPLITALYVAKVHGLSVSDFDMEKFVKAKASGDVKYDKNLVEANLRSE
ncbi:MAG: hypothetical protein GAK33_01312 [Burkholderia lata]|uniref:Uncharacterized protein n=1 Tax=Burkholderia lata (strain ATCC 17760 / DSM 23089 / LMG 22485 / NCIMB 9086 / R18194 / 383) TaxID=482957 RepID=A0A833PW61_BURL3|nr:hypothetical protein [Burkholderia lata]KAF1039473.1 MAG: hypothetical protein GAK33_01312 [Burkholderia lata]